MKLSLIIRNGLLLALSALGLAACGGNMEIREPHTFSRQTIDVWRRDLRAIGSQVGKARIVQQNDDYVWWPIRS